MTMLWCPDDMYRRRINEAINDVMTDLIAEIERIMEHAKESENDYPRSEIVNDLDWLLKRMVD